MLFAVSRNKCAFPGCIQQIVDDDAVIGQLCHIRGASPGGPRYDASQTPLEREAFENFLLLCPTHHVKIDADEEKYPIERLSEMKWRHEWRSKQPVDFGEDMEARLVGAIEDQLRKEVAEIKKHVAEAKANTRRALKEHRRLAKLIRGQNKAIEKQGSDAAIHHRKTVVAAGIAAAAGASIPSTLGSIAGSIGKLGESLGLPSLRQTLLILPDEPGMLRALRSERPAAVVLTCTVNESTSFALKRELTRVFALANWRTLDLPISLGLEPTSGVQLMISQYKFFGKASKQIGAAAISTLTGPGGAAARALSVSGQELSVVFLNRLFGENFVITVGRVRLPDGYLTPLL